jgi:hypothetical protein
MALYSIEQMRGLDIVLQQTTFEKFMMHPLVKDMIHEYSNTLIQSNTIQRFWAVSNLV